MTVTTNGLITGIDPASVLTEEQVSATQALVSGGGIFQVASGTATGKSGLVNGTSLATGQTWDLTGTGAATAAFSSDAISSPGQLNTYCRVNTGQPVRRCIQQFSGPLGTVAIMLDGTLNDMLHVNFTSGATAVATYWKSGVGTAIAVEAEVQINAVPNINDGAPHELIVDIAGNNFSTFVDGALISIGMCKYMQSIVGNWVFAQLHTGVADKIYGVETLSFQALPDEDERFPTRQGVVDALAITTTDLLVGTQGDATFLPEGAIYFHHATGKKVSMSSAGATMLDVFATVTGQASTFRLRPTLGTTFDIVAGGDGVLRMKYQGTDRITIPVNTQRVDQTVPQKLPTSTVAGVTAAYAPATFAGCMVYLSDGASNKKVAVSDGTAWRYPDGTAV